MHEYHSKTNEEIGAIHLGISNISVLPKQPLQIKIHNGITQTFLKAKNIKEKADWVNALNESKEEVIHSESNLDVEAKLITENNEKLNEALATNIFNKFDPLYQKCG